MTRSEIIELMARAHDAETAAQMGEPSPWDADPASGVEFETFKSETLAAMERALEALDSAGLAVIRREYSHDIGAAIMQVDYRDVTTEEAWLEILSLVRI